MKRFLNLVVPLLLGTVASAQLQADEPAIRKFLGEYVDAFNKQDLKAVATKWAENATHVDRETGERTEGRAAIQADLAEVFKGPAKPRLSGRVDRVRLVKPDVASVDGITTTSMPDEDPAVSQFTAILVKQGDKWQIDTLEEMPEAQPATASDALQELAWLEGNWVDDSKESPVISTFRWSANRSFLIRSFSTKDGAEVIPLGTQIIGWDPRSQQIRSWTFNSDGSFGDGTWTKTGDDWQIKSTQTLTDGSAASGTYVVSPLEGDSFTLGLIGQEVEGEPVPSVKAVTLVRVPNGEMPAGDALKPKKP